MISIKGTVQGVGFRPFIYRTAVGMGLAGHVLNTGDGVLIEAEGREENLQSFIERIKSDHPPLARVQEMSIDPISPRSTIGFSIAESKASLQADTQISPDIAPCNECIAEFLDPKDRRHLYPFINCTNCGPRYTIIESLPYDRAKTTMKEFTMCDECAAEYKNPADRRFHAQPDACAECGPRLEFHRWSLACPEQSRRVAGRSSDPLADTIAAIENGGIVAIKGVGGFHLACDATNTEAVTKLRSRKKRDEKPFAIMVGDIETARKLCYISEIEEELLESPQRPIVILKKRDNPPISDAVAPGNRNLGLMLPSSPLHYLLFEHPLLLCKEGLGEVDHKDLPHPVPPLTKGRGCESRVPHPASRVFVMTSGNISDEPIAYENDEAVKRLSGIADAFLLHNRDIRRRVDDSIARMISGSPIIIRRARGYVPTPLRLAFKMPRVLALGADLKGAICLTKGHNAFLSQHLGDLENELAHCAFEDAIEHMKRILDIRPEIIACDMHPDYFSTRYAYSRVTGHPSTLLGAGGSRIAVIQHHHAHIASCMAENDLPNEEVIGIALDGMGYGTDGTIWGGEILIADYKGFKRAAHFRPVPMPGGDAAAKEPWRMAVSYLSRVTRHASRENLNSTFFRNIDNKSIQLVEQMVEKGFNCPMTSSCGRLFDAVAAIIGLRTVNTFEGQAAIELEQIVDENEDGCYEFGTRDPRPETRNYDSKTLLEIDFGPTFVAIVEEVSQEIAHSTISARFHNTLVEALARTCLTIQFHKSLSVSRVSGPGSRICLSGGCFQNALLTTRLKKRLEDEGFKVYTHSLVPPNDGGIALGQAVVATHKTREA